jgi:hypothetical protein
MSKSNIKSCQCWKEKEEALRRQGYKIDDRCYVLELDTRQLTLHGHYALPLQRRDGKRMGRKDPQSMTISHCPFCGREL